MFFSCKKENTNAAVSSEPVLIQVEAIDLNGNSFTTTNLLVR